MRYLPVVVVAFLATEARAERTVSGTVIDEATGKPIVGALVAVGAGEAGTDDLGKFTITNVPFGRLDVVVIADGYRAFFGSARVDEDITVRMQADASGEVIEISGRVPSG